MNASTFKIGAAVGCCVWAASVWGQAAYNLQGDVGGAVYRTPAIVRTSDDSNTVLPYVYADYGPFYARINTFGFKVFPMGAGNFELATRITLEGYKSTQVGIEDRANPFPIGVGTFQKTRYGGFFVYDFYDVTSGGNLFDASYVAKFRVGRVTVYPQIGVERRSAEYVQHLYGVTAAESAATGMAVYTPSSSVNPNAGVTLQYPLSARMNLTYQLRKKWLDASMTDSPLVSAQSQTTGFLAITRSFE
jgi:outer membrane protein